MKNEKEKSGFSLKPRDIAIFETIHTCRALTSTQIAAKFYLRDNGEPRNDVHTSMDASPRCRKRLLKFHDKNFLKRDESPRINKAGVRPYLYSLDEKGATELAQLAGVPLSKFGWRPRDNQLSASRTLPHLMALNDVRISIEVDAQQRNIQILAWETEQELAARSMKVLLEEDGIVEERQFIPDGYFCLYEDAGYSSAYFLEIDRDTEHAPIGSKSIRSNYFTTKIKQYLSYFALDKPMRDFGYQAIRVLTVTTDQKRLEKLLKATESVGGGKHFWFTTFADIVPIKSALTKPIWWQAGDRTKRSLIW